MARRRTSLVRYPTSSTRANSAPPLRTYTTTFALTENPISESSLWVNGFTDGGLWQDCRTSGGTCFGVAASAGYDDCIAHVQGFNLTRHSAKGTYMARAAYTPPSSQEAELGALMQITNGNARFYELSIGFGGAPQLVRWNGGLGDFTIQGLSDDNLSGGKGWTDAPSITNSLSAADGDTVELRAIVDGSGVPTLQVYIRNTLAIQVKDTSAFKITTGNPGLGFFARAGTGLDMSAVGWYDFTASDL